MPRVEARDDAVRRVRWLDAREDDARATREANRRAGDAMDECAFDVRADGARTGRRRDAGARDENEGRGKRADGAGVTRRALEAVDGNAGRRGRTRGGSPASARRTSLAGSTPGRMSARHASRVREIEEDEMETTPERGGEGDEGERATSRGTGREVNETMSAFKSLAYLALSPSELDVSKRRAPTPMNTPTALRFDAASPTTETESPVVGTRDEETLTATISKIVRTLDVDEDAFDAFVAPTSAGVVASDGRAPALALFTLAFVLVAAVGICSIIASSERRVVVVIDGAAFAARWWWRTGRSWSVFTADSFDSYGDFMRARALEALNASQLERFTRLHRALDVARRLIAFSAFASAALSVAFSAVAVGGKLLASYPTIADRVEESDVDTDWTVNYAARSSVGGTPPPTPPIHPQIVVAAERNDEEERETTERVFDVLLV